MTRRTLPFFLPLLALLTFAACGVDSAPKAPIAKPGITVTGTVSTGIARNGG